MKNLNPTLILTAVAVTLGVTAAYGQENMIANVPFSFRITGAELPAGKYTVAPLSSGSTIQFRNVETGKGAFVLVQNSAKSANQNPRLIFRCGGSGCSLASLWFSADRGWEFSQPRVKDIEKERLATIYGRRSKAQ
ncbi:MAG: hypothetical protein DMG59_13520 [Acidobacteria bacterium]|nr:MAG: hypothetical protein DMG59_13520 [Acidobacteriota bacterium]